MKKAFRIAAVVFLLFLFVLYAARPSAPEKLSVHFLDVGQGDAILIRLPSDETILVDGGRGNRVLPELGRVMPWWKRSIDYVIVTHPDSDHYGGIAGVVEKYQIGMMLVNGDSDGSDGFRVLMEMASDRGILLTRVARGYTLSWESGIELAFVWPPEAYRANEDNGRSLSALMTWRDASFLFTADITKDEETLMMQHLPSRQIDVLKVGHHGSRTSSDEAFIRAIRPRFCIISAGKGNAYGHPHAEVLERLHGAGCVIRSTPEDGTIAFVSVAGSDPALAAKP